jgi:phenylacetate-CoA ligase
MDLYAEMLNRVFFPTWEGVVRRRPTVRIQRYLEQTQWRSLDELEAIQIGSARKLLRHSYDHIPFWRAQLDKYGLRPEDVHSVDDLRRLPILDRATARANTETRESKTPPLVAIRKRTSGSSGEPLVFGYDWGSEHWRQATKLRGYAWAGYRIGAKSVHYWGMLPYPTKFKQLKSKLSRTLKQENYLDCMSRADADLERVANEMERYRPEIFIAYSQAAADLARYVNARGRKLPPVSVICAAERVMPSDRAAMVQAFGDGIFESYGSREVMLMAHECEAHDGMHVSMENLIVEIIVKDPDGTERPAKEGETGEVVVTDLHNLAMPFIRYASGDLATARGRAACACGRQLLRIGPIEGRVTEKLTGANGQPVSGLLVEVATAAIGDTLQAYQIVQRKDRSVTIRLEGNPGKEVGEKVRTVISPYLGELPINVEHVDRIALDRSGKRRIIVVEQ